MASSFRGQDIFGSGPHRFAVGRRGLAVVPLWVLNGVGFNDGSGSVALGEVDFEVVVRGRLVGATEAQLWTRREGVRGEATMPVKVGALVDLDGRSWAGMTMIRYEEAGPIERGRVWSVRYTATFRRLAS
jgi:hypothetical protein